MYTEKHVPSLSPAAQGQVGIVNAKHIWQLNQQFWADKRLPIKQEMIFASTGTKKPEDPPWKYVEAFAGSRHRDQPAGHQRPVQKSGRTLHAAGRSDAAEGGAGRDRRQGDMQKLEETLMQEGLSKFADPQHALLALIASKREQLKGK